MERPKATVLVVDDEPDLLFGLTGILEADGYRVVTAVDGREAVEKARKEWPDAVILDIMLPVLDGKAVKELLNEDHRLADIPVIFLSALGTPEDIVRGLRLAAEDYIVKPFESSELLARLARVLERRKHYEKQFLTDPLSGLGNRYGYERQAEMLFRIAQRYGRAFTMGVFDIDRLKNINDRFGHSAGDAAIRAVADAMRETFRMADVILRYGGDEFVVFFPESSQAVALRAVHRFENALALATGVLPFKLTVSYGLAEYCPETVSATALFDAADREMYAAKKARFDS